MGQAATRRTVRQCARARRGGSRQTPPHRRAHHRDRGPRGPGRDGRRARHQRPLRTVTRPDPLEFRAARRPRRCAARVSPNAARPDCGRRNQFGLHRADRAQHQLFADRDDPWTVHAITSPRYARVHHDELADRVLDLMAQHPAWHLPLGYKDGVIGAERVPSGAYLGDRDMFLFLVDGNRSLDDPTDASQAGLFRGFMLRNSDVGAAALSLEMFLFRAVCANHIIWGFHHVAGFRRRHIGASIHHAWTHSLREVRAALDADLADDRTTTPASQLPGARGDTRAGDRGRRAAAGSAAQARARRLHDGGAA